MNNTELLKGLRDGLEAGLMKEAGVSELNDGQRQFIDMTVAEFEKMAAEGTTLGFMAGLKNAFSGQNIGNAAVKAGIPLLGGLGVAAAAKAVGAISSGMNRSKFETALRLAISRNAILQQADQERLKSLADSVYHSAPTVSTDPNILGQVLVNAIRGENLDIQTVKMLGDLEARRTQGQALTARNFSL